MMTVREFDTRQLGNLTMTDRLIPMKQKQHTEYSMLLIVNF